MSHDGRRPLILVIDEDLDALALIESELDRRYSSDHDIHCVASVQEAEEVIDAHPADNVAIVMVDQRLSGSSGIDFLTRCNVHHPRTKRLILIRVGDRAAFDDLTRSVAMGQADYFVRKPMKESDEGFHRVVAEMLDEWAAMGGHRAVAVHLVAGRNSPRAHEMRDLLQRNGVPYRSVPRETREGRALLDSVGIGQTDVPVMLLFDGKVLVDPTNAEAADALGASVKPGTDLYDLAIVGGGPAGLAAAVYASSEGLKTLVLEREAVGGQAGTSSRIRNYLGFPHGVTGVELAQRAYEQAWLFGTDFAFMQQASILRPALDGYEILTMTGDRVRTRSVIIATGVSYRRLGIETLDRLVGMGVFYGAAASETVAVTGHHVFLVGGGNSAGQAAVYLARYASQVTILVRGPSLAEGMSDYLIKEIAAIPSIDIRYNAEIVDGGGRGRLEKLTIADRVTGGRSDVDCAALFVMIGAQPHTEWLPPAIARDDWGYIRTGRDLDLTSVGWREGREPHHLETSLPGVFAAGDIRHRSVKRVASAVGEGSVAIQMVHQFLDESRRGKASGAPMPGDVQHVES